MVGHYMSVIVCLRARLTTHAGLLNAQMSWCYFHNALVYVNAYRTICVLNFICSLKDFKRIYFIARRNTGKRYGCNFNRVCQKI